MPSYEFTLSDGTTHKVTGASPEDAYASLIARMPAAGQEQHSFAGDFGRGFRQGLVDPIDGAIEIANHVVSRTLTPERLQEWQRSAQQAGWTGTAGRVLGNVINPLNLIPASWAGRAAAVLPLAGRAATAARAAVGGATAAGLHPVGKTDDYTMSKLGQVALGGATAGSLGALASQAAATVRTTPGGHLAAHMFGHALGLPWYLRYPFVRAVGPSISQAGQAGARTLGSIPPGSAGAAAGELSRSDEEE